MLVRPVSVCESVSHAPNGRPAPNIHTWDSHMPYGYFPEMFENFTKLSQKKAFWHKTLWQSFTHVQKLDQNHTDSR